MFRGFGSDTPVTSRPSPGARSSCVKQERSGLSMPAEQLPERGNGDVIFGLSFGKKKADVNTVGLLGEVALIESVKRAITQADGLSVIPAYRDLERSFTTHSSR